MKTSRAVALRVNNLLIKNNMSAYKLSQASFIAPSTLSNILNEENKSINLSTIYKLAYGFGMTIVEFFDDEIFKDEDIIKELI